MAEVHVISKGPTDAKKYFDGEGGWTASRIDAKEYASQEAAAQHILSHRLGEGDIVQEPGPIPGDWFEPRF